MKTTIEVIREQMLSDDECPEKQEQWIQEAYKKGSLDDFLIALCGWSWKSIQDLRKK